MDSKVLLVLSETILQASATRSALLVQMKHLVLLFLSVEAMQLGDCGQEKMLINGLTAGSRIFLTKDESQHFVKE